MSEDASEPIASGVTVAQNPMTYLEEVGGTLEVRFRGEVGATVLDLKQLMGVDPERLDAQLAETPQLLAYFGNLFESIRKSYLDARRQRRILEAVLDESIRESSEKKPTEAAVKNQIRRDSSFQYAEQEEEAYEVLLGRVEKLYWSLKERRGVLQDISHRQLAERSGSRPVGTGYHTPTVVGGNT